MPTPFGRHPSIKDGLGFRKESKNLTSQRAPIPNKEKGKAPMASSTQRNHAFIYNDRKFSRNAHYNRSYDAFNSHAMLLALLLCMVEVSLGKIMLCIMCLGEYVMNRLLFTMLAILHLRLYVRMKK
jgi:hypothetical protein